MPLPAAVRRLFFFSRSRLAVKAALLLGFFLCSTIGAFPLYGQHLTKNTFVDVAEQVGLTDRRESFSVAWIDYNEDGWTDLWLGTHGNINPRLYLNQGNGTFADISARALPFSMDRDTHGSAWADYDNDGDPDLMQAVGGGGGQGDAQESNYLLENQNGVLVDRTQETRLAYPYGRGRTALWFDYDGDGRLDVLQTNTPRPAPPHAPTQLFRQASGQDFTNANGAADVHAPNDAQFAQLADVTGDGTADLIVHGFPFPQRIYQGGALPMERVDTTLIPEKVHFVSEAAIADFNGDLHPDFYLTRRRNASSLFQANDRLMLAWLLAKKRPARLQIKTSQPIRLRNSFPWMRFFFPPSKTYIGKNGYSPEEWGSEGLALDPENADNWGLDTSRTGGLLIGYHPKEQTWTLLLQERKKRTPFAVEGTGSFERVSLSGRTDSRVQDLLWIYDPETGTYVDRTAEAGPNLMRSCTSVGAGDFDNDMDIDLYLSCAHTIHGLPNVLLENQGDATFRRVPGAGGAVSDTLVTNWNTFGVDARVAVADHDRDGFLDLLIPSTSAIQVGGEPASAFPTTPVQLFKNRGNGNHWIEVDLEGTTSNADGIGARVDVTAGGVTQRRFQNGGMRHFVQDHQRLHFGLGPNTQVDTLTVRWPSGHTDRFTRVEADQVLKVKEGAENLRSLTVSDLTLSPMGPNPFRTVTRFKLTTDRRQHVRVEVFDMLGRRVALLQDDVLAEGAIKVLRLPGDNLSSGVYVVRAVAGGQQRVLKVVHVR